MGKKNINTGVVRTCTILLLTVFTIGRKYGQDQNAENLINDLKQQPCACCLNFNEVEASAKTIDGKKQELEAAKKGLEAEKKGLEGEIQKKDLENNQLLGEKNQLRNMNVQLVEEKNNINNLYEKRKIENENLNKNIKELKEFSKKIKNEKTTLEANYNNCRKLFTEANKEKDKLAEILKNTKTNVKTEEYVKFYNSIFAEKKAKIKFLLNDEKLEEKEYTFYVPFKFKDCGNCFKENYIIDTLKEIPNFYNIDRSLSDILRSLLERTAFEKFGKENIIDVTTLKEIYFCTKFNYNNDKIIDKNKNFVIKGDEGKSNIIVPEGCFYSTSEYNKNNQNKSTSYRELAKGIFYKNKKQYIKLNYSELIELVNIDEYLEKKEKHKDDEDLVALAGLEDFDEKLVKNMVISEDDKELFLLKLDFKDPECIALLESVGKGNYGVVKKGLTIENGEWVTKAIKFTCSNSKFSNSSKENILKEIRAGKVINEIGVGNKIAFVQDYMKKNKFIKRYEYKEENKEEEKIVPLTEETEDGNLTNAVYTTFLNKKLEPLPEKRQNVRENFENNVFSNKGDIGEDLYIMFMDIVNGTDLFLSKEKNKIDINILGKMLFEVLNSLYTNHVALKDIKPKNIMWNEKNKKFSIIDVQTLGLVDRKLTDPFGTPELWPFFKTLNLNLNINDEIIGDGKKNNLYDVFCYSIDDNFVDIYAACMTMYFTKFSTYTAAGLLTLLLKWIVLDEKKEISIKNKIDFLKNYEQNYTSYITDIKNKEKIEELEANKNLIKYFFEEIDDKNLNDIQKNDLANLLKQVITLGNETNIFYLLEKIKNIVNKYENKYSLEDDIKYIIPFYKYCVGVDFKNFAQLYFENCKYADVIKYVLCYGSCLNYNGGKEEMEVNDILEKLNLKKDIGDKDKEFFDDPDNAIKNVIANLQSSFNQTFIIDLLKILPLEEYYEILEHDVNKGSVNYYFKNKIDSLNEEEKEKTKDEIEKQKKIFYLLRYLEINKLFHIPKDLVKINSLIDENTDDNLNGNILI